jgi:LacI family transcriptional regulator
VGDYHQQVEGLSAHLPLVMVDRYLNEDRYNYVKLDNHLASYEATEHLVDKGYQKIGIIGYDTQMLHIQGRFQGYQKALQALKPTAKPLLGEVRYNHIKEDVATILDDFLEKENIDALIFATNSLTIAGLYYCLKKDIRVPDQLAIVGFDGNVAFDFFYAPLTYIAQPVKEMGKAAVRVLLDAIEGKSAGQHINLSHQLIIRAST